MSYRGKEIARVPAAVIVTAQDWLRQARKSEDVKKQIQFLTRALEEKKGDENTRKALAGLYLKAGMTEKGTREYEKVLAADPRDRTALDALSRIYMNAGRYEKVLPLYGNHPPGSQGRRGLCQHRFRLRESRPVEPGRRQLPGLPGPEPGQRGSPFPPGRVLEKAGDDKEALELYESVSKQQPDNPSVWNALADGYLKAGRYKEAIPCTGRSSGRSRKTRRRTPTWGSRIPDREFGGGSWPTKRRQCPLTRRTRPCA